MGQLDEAVRHFEDSLNFCISAFPPEYAWSAFELSSVLIQRNDPSDRARARHLELEANKLALGLKMGSLHSRLTKVSQGQV